MECAVGMATKIRTGFVFGIFLGAIGFIIGAIVGKIKSRKLSPLTNKD